MCEQGLKTTGSVQYDAPHDELIWLKGLIEMERKNMPAARLALAQLRTILHSSSINAMNYKPAYKYYLHLLAKISAEEGKIQEAATAINDLKWIKSSWGIGARITIRRSSSMPSGRFGKDRATARS